MAFGFILLVAQLNPNAFLVVLEVFTSLSLNMEGGRFELLSLGRSTRLTCLHPTGFFVGYMFYVSRSGKLGAVADIPLPVEFGATTFWVVTCTFFAFAGCIVMFFGCRTQAALTLCLLLTNQLHMTLSQPASCILVATPP